LLSFSFLDSLLESLDLLARGSPIATCTSEETGWLIECWTPPQGSGKLIQGKRLQPWTPLCRYMGTILQKCPSMVCASNIVWEVTELRRLCGLTYVLRYTPATLNAGVQDAAHQALTNFCQELWDLDNQWLSGKEEYVYKIEDLQSWERVQEQKIQALQALSSAQKAIIWSLRGQLQQNWWRCRWQSRRPNLGRLWCGGLLVFQRRLVSLGPKLEE
jgi:hypothetical protein